MKWLYIAMIAAQSLDAGTTIQKMHQGCVETLWPTQRPALVAVVKGAAVTMTVVIRHSHPTLSMVVAGVGTASGLYGGIHNLQQRCR